MFGEIIRCYIAALTELFRFQNAHSLVLCGLCHNLFALPILIFLNSLSSCLFQSKVFHLQKWRHKKMSTRMITQLTPTTRTTPAAATTTTRTARTTKVSETARLRRRQQKEEDLRSCCPSYACIICWTQLDRDEFMECMIKDAYVYHLPFVSGNPPLPLCSSPVSGEG